MSEVNFTNPNDGEDIPVEELIRITREFTRRITNQDRQRLAMDLRESGHQRSMQISAPLTLQQFFSGEIDLDNELARRYSNAALMSHVGFEPKLGAPARRQATALFNCQDDSVSMAVDAPIGDKAEATLEFTFTLYSTLSMSFLLPQLAMADRLRWLELMRRENGIAFLWTRDRWEQPYLIFVIREYFARVYAYSPQGYEAAIRMTPDMVTSLVNWLEGLWFPGGHAKTAETDIPFRATQIKRTIELMRQPEDAPKPSAHQPEDIMPAEPAAEEENDLSASDLEW